MSNKNKSIVSIAEAYVNRFPHYPPLVEEEPAEDIGLTVVIPCYNDTEVFWALESLEKNSSTRAGVEVIVVVNNSENDSLHPKTLNNDIYNMLLFLKQIERYKRFDLQVIRLKDVPDKIAGVGNARKAGMDEALHRYAARGYEDGIILSLDADCLVAGDYLCTVEQFFEENKKAGAVTLQFRHRYKDPQVTTDERKACELYELYLRYLRLSLKNISGFPYAFHSIGSCFAVRASVYAAAGGMSRRKAGEDFYFLNKIASTGQLEYISRPVLVFPSARSSSRTPYGTGKSISNIMEEGALKVYNFSLFLVLKKFYASFPALYCGDKSICNAIPPEIVDFAGKDNIEATVGECRQHSGCRDMFVKRMFSRFDMFFAVRFMNSFRQSAVYPPVDVVEGAKEYLRVSTGTMPPNVFEGVCLSIFFADFLGNDSGIFWGTTQV